VLSGALCHLLLLCGYPLADSQAVQWPLHTTRVFIRMQDPLLHSMPFIGPCGPCSQGVLLQAQEKAVYLHIYSEHAAFKLSDIKKGAFGADRYQD